MNETGKPLGCLDAVMTVGRPRQLILCRDTRVPLDKIRLLSMDLMSEHRLRANKKSHCSKIAELFSCLRLSRIEAVRLTIIMVV